MVELAPLYKIFDFLSNYTFSYSQIFRASRQNRKTLFREEGGAFDLMQLACFLLIGTFVVEEKSAFAEHACHFLGDRMIEQFQLRVTELAEQFGGRDIDSQRGCLLSAGRNEKRRTIDDIERFIIKLPQCLRIANIALYMRVIFILTRATIETDYFLGTGCHGKPREPRLVRPRTQLGLAFGESRLGTASYIQDLLLCQGAKTIRYPGEAQILCPHEGIDRILRGKKPIYFLLCLIHDPLRFALSLKRHSVLYNSINITNVKNYSRYTACYTAKNSSRFHHFLMQYADIRKLLGDKADSLLKHTCETIGKDKLHLPSMQTIQTVFAASDRSPKVIANLKSLYNHGRLKGTGYVSILPVDQGIEHSAGASFAKNPAYFDPESIVKLAIEGGCNGVASTVGALGMVSKKYAAKIPFIVKLNHNELLTYPNKFDQVMFGSVAQAKSMGAAGVGATIYFGSPESGRQIMEVSQAFAEAHRQGMFTVLWCYLRSSSFKKDGVDYHLSADLTGQANHLGVTIEADIIKQKLPECNGGFTALNTGGSSYGKLDKRMYTELATDHPIDLCRYQVANCYMGRIGLINSGGASGENDLQQAVMTAVINKRAGGAGLISGRKAFQKPMEQGVEILHAIQDVYLSKEVTVA